MIYRILIRITKSQNYYCPVHPNYYLDDYIGRVNTGAELNSDMLQLGLQPPKNFTNTRARFFFTERGWDRYGRELIKRIKQRGYEVKVIRKKQPNRSEVVYMDPYQLAILPSKSK